MSGGRLPKTLHDQWLARRAQEVAAHPMVEFRKRERQARAKTPRPHCRHCGKPLRRARDYLTQITGREWGDYADDLFCGLRCGHGWAVKTLRDGSKAKGSK